MRDMFQNYDNDIDRKTCCKPCMPPLDPPPKILASTPNLSLVVDAFGNEIGIAARYRTPFELYFMMDGCVEGSSIEELVCNSIITFQVLTKWHEAVLTKNLNPADCYIGDDTIKVSLTAEDVEALKRETYGMELTLSWPGGYYILYSENNGFLTVQ